MRKYRIQPGPFPHFCTCTIVGWIGVFSEPDYFETVGESLQFCRKNKGLLLNAYVIMPTHLHLIVSPSLGSELTGLLRDFKRHTSKRISSLLERDGRHRWLQFFAGPRPVPDARKGRVRFGKKVSIPR